MKFCEVNNISKMYKIFICLLLEVFIYVGGTLTQSEVKTVKSSLQACNSDFEDASLLGMGRILLKKTEKMNYQEAVTFCQKRHSTLVEIESEEQMTFVNNRLKDLDKDSDGKPIVWCGGASDDGAEGDWRWTQSGKKVDDFVWWPGEPGGAHQDHFLGFESFRDYYGADIDGARLCYPLCQQKT